MIVRNFSRIGKQGFTMFQKTPPVLFSYATDDFQQKKLALTEKKEKLAKDVNKLECQNNAVSREYENLMSPITHDSSVGLFDSPTKRQQLEFALQNLVMKIHKYKDGNSPYDGKKSFCIGDYEELLFSKHFTQYLKKIYNITCWTDTWRVDHSSGILYILTLPENSADLLGNSAEIVNNEIIKLEKAEPGIGWSELVPIFHNSITKLLKADLKPKM